MSKRLTLEEIKIKLKDVNPNIEILSDKYINSKTKLKCKCLLDGHIWYPIWNSLSRGVGCPMCSGKVLHNDNVLSSVRPDLVKYFVKTEDADNYTVSSGKKVALKCLYCGKEKRMTINKLSIRGFSCKNCSDGISLGEKIGINLFNELGIKFETQKTFHWSKNKRYDLYFVFNGDEFLCEINGLQHYKESKGVFKSKTLKEQQDNDKLKYRLAVKNGIDPKNYIIIDARYSEFELLKENYIKSLCGLLDLSSVDWDKIWLYSQKSILIEVCSYWKNKKEEIGTMSLAKKFGISRSTIIRYLSRGSKLGLCNYNPKKEALKNATKRGKLRCKIVYQYSLENVFIKKWNSTMDVERALGFSHSCISACCIGRRKTAYGYKWSNVAPTENK